MDPIQLQRLVDGELSFEQTQSVLCGAKDQPQLWETIATAFVENQIWQSEFSSQLECSSAAKPVGSAIATERSAYQVGRWFALAASLLLAVSVGFLVSWPSDSVPGENSGLLANGQQASANTSLERGAELDDLNQRPAVYHRVQVEDPTGNQYLNSDVPLYRVNPQELEHYVSNDGYLSDDVRRRAADSGYNMQKNVRFLSGRLNDGRRFVIPVRKYSFSQGQ